MAEYIEREAAKRLTCQYCAVTDICVDDSECAIAASFDAIPAADVRPVVKAKIADMRYTEDDGEWKCSHCGWQFTLCVCGKDVTSKIHFCPNCGADMRGEQDDITRNAD